MLRPHSPSTGAANAASSTSSTTSLPQSSLDATTSSSSGLAAASNAVVPPPPAFQYFAPRVHYSFYGNEEIRIIMDAIMHAADAANNFSDFLERARLIKKTQIDALNIEQRISLTEVIFSSPNLFRNTKIIYLNFLNWYLSEVVPLNTVYKNTRAIKEIKGTRVARGKCILLGYQTMHSGLKQADWSPFSSLILMQDSSRLEHLEIIKYMEPPFHLNLNLGGKVYNLGKLCFDQIPGVRIFGTVQKRLSKINTELTKKKRNSPYKTSPFIDRIKDDEQEDKEAAASLPATATPAAAATSSFNSDGSSMTSMPSYPGTYPGTYPGPMAPVYYSASPSSTTMYSSTPRHPHPKSLEYQQKLQHILKLQKELSPSKEKFEIIENHFAALLPDLPYSGTEEYASALWTRLMNLLLRDKSSKHVMIQYFDTLDKILLQSATKKHFPEFYLLRASFLLKCGETGEAWLNVVQLEQLLEGKPVDPKIQELIAKLSKATLAPPQASATTTSTLELKTPATFPSSSPVSSSSSSTSFFQQPPSPASMGFFRRPSVDETTGMDTREDKLDADPAEQAAIWASYSAAHRPQAQMQAQPFNLFAPQAAQGGLSSSSSTGTPSFTSTLSSLFQPSNGNASSSSTAPTLPSFDFEPFR